MNFGLHLEVNTQKLQSMLYHYYCLLFQHVNCEAAFKKYTLTTTKQRSRLDPEADMWVKLSNIRPDFKQDSQCIYNMQPLLMWKTISITYSVCVCVSVSSVTQHAKHMYLITLSSADSPALPYFSTLSHTANFFKKSY